MAAEGEGSEVSIGNAYCVVYRLEKSEWIVTGEGWAQVHLYRDTADGTFRLVGWTVQDYNVVCNCNVTSTCKYKKKSADFHKFTDEDDNVFGFGFYKKEESIEESEKFMHIVCKTIDELARAAGPMAPAAPAPPAALPPPQPPSTNAKPGSSIAAKTAALGGLKFGGAPPALVTQGSFRDNTPAAPAPPASAPPSSGGVKPKPPALPAHNNAHGGAAAASGVASPTGRQSVSGGTIGASGKVVPAPPAPRRSVSTYPSVSSAPTTPIGASAPAAPAAPAAPGSTGGSKVAPPPRKPTHSKTMSSSTVARINKPDETAKTTDSLPSNGAGAGAAAGGSVAGKPRPPPLGKAQSVATPGRPQPPGAKGPSPPGSAAAAAAAGAGADSKGEMSPKQTAMQKMEDLAIEPKTHRTASVAMDMIYENKQVPLGKLKILPPKKAKKYADTATRPIITDPYGIIHTQHVKYDANTRSYQGLPPEWESQLNKQFGLPPMQVETVKLAEYKGRIPVVLEQMKKYLYANGGLQQEGIFRLAPDGDESTYVKQQLNENKFVKCNDVNCISNLIKVWFRDLPVHLLNDIKQESITACDTEEQAGKIIAAELNEVNGSIFLWLLDMCIEVSKYSNVNKMTPQNLAIVIGPNLFTPQMTDPMASLMFSQKVANFLHKSILWRKSKLIEQA